MMRSIREYFQRLFSGTSTTQIVWLFFARPEAWLDKSGERHFDESIFWSCEKGTRVGDLALLYRISLDRIKVDEMTADLGMTKELAEQIKRSELGKDIPLMWKVTSVRRRFLPCPWLWGAGCQVERLHWFESAITLAELKRSSQLRRSWPDLNRNFQAAGRAALQIPTEAWRHLSEILRARGFHNPGDMSA